jgi:hypothetical protein
MLTSNMTNIFIISDNQTGYCFNSVTNGDDAESSNAKASVRMIGLMREGVHNATVQDLGRMRMELRRADECPPAVEQAFR